MKENYQTFRIGNTFKTKFKNTLLGLSAIFCFNSVNAQSGSALNIDGTNDYVTVPSNTGLQVGAGNFTIEFWAKPTLVNGAFHYVVTKDNTNSDLEFLVGLGSNDRWFCYTKNSSNYVGGLGFATANTWAHVACTYDGANQNLYVNGVFQGSVAVGAVPHVNTQNILIGARTATSPQQFFAGDIDEVRIWNYARTSCQINSFMNCEISGSATGLVANYHFNQGVAGNTNTGITSVSDASGNSNTGTLINSALAGASSNWVTPGGVVSGFTTPAPLPTIAVNSGTISAGSSFTMVPSGGVTYTYTPSGPVVTPTTTSSYTVSGTASTGCTNTAVSTVAIQAAALNMDGVNDYVVVPSNTGLQVGAGNFTIEFWAKPTLVNGAFHYVVTKDNTNSDLEFLVGLGSNDRWFCYTKNSSNYVGSLGFATANTWYHVACTYDGANQNLYVNGVFQGSVAVGAVPHVNTQNILIGGRTASSPQQFFAGDIDEVRIWNYARTACQISSYMNYEIANSTAGLMANYHFNQGGSGSSNAGVISLADASGNSNNGTLTNFALTGTTSNWVAPGGVVSGSTNTTTPCGNNSIPSGLNFDGNNDAVVVPNNASFNFTTQYTFESWINLSGYNYATIVSKFDDDGDNRSWMINMGETGDPTKLCVVQSELGTWTNPIQWNTGFTPALNTWYHIAVVFDSSLPTGNIKLYVNGVYTAQTNWAYSITPSPANLYFGGYDGFNNGFNNGANSRFLNGTIDDARLWNIARTAGQIAANYNSELTGNESGLVAYYQFNDGGQYQNNTSVANVNDLTTNNNDGTFKNLALVGCKSNYICGAPALGGTCVIPAIVNPIIPIASANCVINLNPPTTTNACATVTFTGTTSSATSFSTAGTYTVNWLFDDGAGNTINATQTVVVNAPGAPAVAIAESVITSANAATGGTASASSIYGTNFAATAFDNDTITQGWGSTGGGLPAWLEYDFGSGNSKIITKYSFFLSSVMQGGWGNNSYNLSIWTFEGFNGSTWDVLDTRNDNSLIQDVWHSYTFTNTVSYQKYRMNITSSQGSGYAFITELRLYQTPSGSCANKTFTSNVNSFAVPANYQWQVNGNNVGANSPVLMLPNFLINDVITCDINTANTCVTSSVATSNQVVLTTGTVLSSLSATICAGETYTTGANTYTAAGTYTINSTAVSGCDSITLVNLTVDLCTSINSLNSIKGLVKVQPNPNNGLFTIELMATSDVIITNAIGQVVLTEKMEVGTHNLDIQNQSTGIYFVKVIQDGKQHVIKLIKE